MRKIMASLMIGSLVAGGALSALAADEVAPKDKILVARSFRTSTLSGLNVRNKQGEKLGTVSDMVIDIPTGKINYVALSVGGVLGVGDKMFAVPYSALKFDHGNDEMFFVLDMPKIVWKPPQVSTSRTGRILPTRTGLTKSTSTIAKRTSRTRARANDARSSSNRGSRNSGIPRDGPMRLRSDWLPFTEGGLA